MEGLVVAMRRRDSEVNQTLDQDLRQELLWHGG